MSDEKMENQEERAPVEPESAESVPGAGDGAPDGAEPAAQSGETQGNAAAEEAEVAEEAAIAGEAVAGEEPKKPSEAEVLRDRLLRLQADFDNYRKRVARDHDELVAQAGADVLKAMLAPMDHLEMALETMAKAASPDDPVLKGVQMVHDEVAAVFERFSLRAVDTKVGAELDPSAEEALGILAVPGIEENRVAVVVRKGYRLHGKVIRAAQVMVGAGAPAAAAAPEASDEGRGEA